MLSIITDEIMKNKDMLVQDIAKGDVDETVDTVLENLEKFRNTSYYKNTIQAMVQKRFGEHPLKNVVIFSTKYNEIMNYEKQIQTLNDWDVKEFILNLYKNETFNYEYLTAGVFGEINLIDIHIEDMPKATRFAKKFVSALGQKENTRKMIYHYIFADEFNLEISGWDWDSEKDTKKGEDTLNGLLKLINQMNITTEEIPQLIQHIGSYVKTQNEKDLFLEFIEDLLNQLA